MERYNPEGLPGFKSWFASELKKCSMFRQDSCVPNIREKDFVRDCVLEFDSFVGSCGVTNARPEMSPEDVRMWWKINGGQFPSLNLLALDFATIPLSSAAAERVFSILRQLFSSTQRSSKQDMVEAACMLRYNYRAPSNDHD
jgi:hypothetical protein